MRTYLLTATGGVDLPTHSTTSTNNPDQAIHLQTSAFHSWQIMSPSETGFIVSAHTLIKITWWKSHCSSKGSRRPISLIPSDTRNRSITHSLQNWVATKALSSISQLEYISTYKMCIDARGQGFTSTFEKTDWESAWPIRKLMILASPARSQSDYCSKPWPRPLVHFTRTWMVHGICSAICFSKTATIIHTEQFKDARATQLKYRNSKRNTRSSGSQNIVRAATTTAVANPEITYSSSSLYADGSRSIFTSQLLGDS